MTAAEWLEFGCLFPTPGLPRSLMSGHPCLEGLGKSWELGGLWGWALGCGELRSSEVAWCLPWIGGRGLVFSPAPVAQQECQLEVGGPLAILSGGWGL